MGWSVGNAAAVRVLAAPPARPPTTASPACPPNVAKHGVAFLPPADDDGVGRELLRSLRWEHALLCMKPLPGP